MESDELAVLLRDVEPEQAASLLSEMEPDEAAEALRDLDDDTRDEVLAAMDPDDAEDLTILVSYDEESAGGVMTTAIITFDAGLTVAEARDLLADHESYDDIARVESVLVLDEAGALVDDILMIDLFMAADADTLGSLVGAPWPVTVPVDATIEDVVEAFVENRGSSIVVVDADDRPLGRILADDVVDALLPHRERGRRHFTGILS